MKIRRVQSYENELYLVRGENFESFPTKVSVQKARLFHSYTDRVIMVYYVSNLMDAREGYEYFFQLRCSSWTSAGFDTSVRLLVFFSDGASIHLSFELFDQ